MKTALRIALILVVGSSLIAPPFAALSAEDPIGSLAVRNPRKKPNPPPDGDKRPPRDKPKPPSDDDKRPPRKKPDERPTPRPDPPEYREDEPVVVVIVPDPICPVCRRHEHYCICWVDHTAEPVTFESVYAVVTVAAAGVNLYMAMDDRSDDFFAASGFFLGGVGVMASLLSDDREHRTTYMIAGLASIGLAMLNLSADGPEADPLDRSGGSSPAKITAVSLSF